MGFDGKYGRVTTEFGDIPDDEPVMVFRGRDAALVPLLDDYVQLCRDMGSPEHHLRLVSGARERIRAWQHHNEVVVPTSMGVAGRDLGNIRPMPEPTLNHDGSDRWTGGDKKDAP